MSPVSCETTMTVLESLKNYFWIVVDDGDWLNDHLCELPHLIQPATEFAGILLQKILGS